MWEEYSYHVQELWHTHRDAMLAGVMLTLAALAYGVGWWREHRKARAPMSSAKASPEVVQSSPRDPLARQTYDRLGALYVSSVDVRALSHGLRHALAGCAERGMIIARHGGPQSSMFCVMAPYSMPLRVSVYAPRPAHIPDSLELLDAHNVIWSRDQGGSIFYALSGVHVGELFGAIWPAVAQGWEATQALLLDGLDAHDTPQLTPTFELSVRKDFILLSCGQRSDEGIAAQVDLSVALFERMIALTNPALWVTRELERLDDLMVHLARHVADRSIAERMIAHAIDERCVEGDTLAQIIQIAREREREGAPELLDALKRRWAMRASDGLTMLDGADNQGGLSAAPEPETHEEVSPGGQ